LVEAAWKNASGLEGNKMGRSERLGLSDFRLRERAELVLQTDAPKGPCCC